MKVNLTLSGNRFDIDITVSFEVKDSPYYPATWDYPEEGGLESVYDAIITESSELDDGEYGPSLVGLKLTDEQIDEYWDDFQKAYDNEVESAKWESAIDALEFGL